MQPAIPDHLPPLDPDSAAHSARVAAHLRERIAAANGAMSFAAFMHESLYAPGLGYYAAGSKKFGRDGDFVTAPEVSSLFGKVLARQVAQCLDSAGGDTVLELGAGSGKLAIDVVQALSELGAVPDRYLILEVSPDLVDRQRQAIAAALPGFVEQIEWIDALPAEFDGVVIANEVFDALPVERFVVRSDGVRQLCVTAAESGFGWLERPAPDELASAVRQLEASLGRGFPSGYFSEVCPAAPALLTDLAAALRCGAMFIFDYGLGQGEYYGEERGGGWLRCHFRHRAHNDPLILNGVQDLTAWVDFTALAMAAVESGLEVASYSTQAEFLLAAGLDQALANLSQMPTETQIRLASEVKLLTLPGEMGENFKSLCLTRNQQLPAALAAANRSHRL